MEKIVKEFNVYNFDELEESVKEDLIKKEQEKLAEDYCEFYLQDSMNCEAEELIEDNFKGAKIDNVYYDLSYSQGSGAMIEFTINIEDLNNKYHFISDEELRFIKDKGVMDDINVYHSDNYYYHEYTFNIKYYDNFGYWEYEDIKDDYNIAEEDFNNLESRIVDYLDTYNKLNKQNSQFIEDIIKVNRELKNYGYNEIEYDFKDEAIMNLQEYKFLENGAIFE